MLDLDEAAAEIQSKSRAQIESDTAWKWASRAIVCMRLAKTAPTGRVLTWVRRSEDYEHEALEHAAMVRDNGATLIAIEGAFATERASS